MNPAELLLLTIPVFAITGVTSLSPDDDGVCDLVVTSDSNSNYHWYCYECLDTNLRGRDCYDHSCQLKQLKFNNTYYQCHDRISGCEGAPLSCSPLQPFSNGEWSCGPDLNSRNRRFLACQTCQAMCHPGYHLKKEVAVKCIRGENFPEWNDTSVAPHCVNISNSSKQKTHGGQRGKFLSCICGTPNIPGVRLGKCGTFREKNSTNQEYVYRLECEVSCKPGFTQVDQVNSTCSEDGHWSGMDKLTGICVDQNLACKLKDKLHGIWNCTGIYINDTYVSSGTVCGLDCVNGSKKVYMNDLICQNKRWRKTVIGLPVPLCYMYFQRDEYIIDEKLIFPGFFGVVAVIFTAVCCLKKIDCFRKCKRQQSSIMTGSPLVLVRTQTCSCQIGETVTLDCSVSAHPAVEEVYWVCTVNGRKCILTIDGTKYKGSRVQCPSLTICDVGGTDQATYTCHATNTEGTSVSPPIRFTLDIGSPVVLVRTQTCSCRIGGTVTLDCSVSAHPAVEEVYWVCTSNGRECILTRDGTKYRGSSVQCPSLTICDVEVTDQATYTCHATNTEGTSVSPPVRFTLDTGSPVVKVGVQTYSGDMGEEVTMNCTVLAYPVLCRVNWVRIANGRHYTLTIDGTKYKGSDVQCPSLTICDVGVSDVATYICHATNSEGTSVSPPIRFTVNTGDRIEAAGQIIVDDLIDSTLDGMLNSAKMNDWDSSPLYNGLNSHDTMHSSSPGEDIGIRSLGDGQPSQSLV